MVVVVGGVLDALQSACRDGRLRVGGRAGGVAAGGVATAGAGGELMVDGRARVVGDRGVCANRSTGVFVGAIDDGVSEYESLTTGMRVLMCLLPTWRAGAAGAIVGAACSFGTASWANET